MPGSWPVCCPRRPRDSPESNARPAVSAKWPGGTQSKAVAGLLRDSALELAVVAPEAGDCLGGLGTR
eukprot:8737107-Alexandrium_andersonii.AAC.1